MRVFYKAVLVLLAVFWLSSCKDNAGDPEKTYNIFGYVMNSDDVPIEGATVVIFKGDKVYKSDTTDENGRFELNGLSAEFASYSVKISADNYQSKELSGLIKDFLEDKFEDGFTVKLQKISEEDDDCCGQLRIKTVKKGTDMPLARAEVKLISGDKIIAIKSSGDDGFAIFDSLCSGKHFIRIALADYLVIEDYIVMGNCDTISAEFQMKLKSDEDCCNNSAFFTIKDKDGTPLNQVNVLFRKSGAVKYQDKSDSDGRVSIKEICKGEYSVLVELEGYKAQEFNIEFDCDMEKEKVIELQKNDSDDCCNNKMKVLVKKNDSDDLINGAKLILWQNGKMVYHSYSDDGFAVIDNICKGKYVAELVKEGFKGLEWTVEFECDKVLEFEKSMTEKADDPCCGKAVIVVKDYETGELLNNVEVKITFNGTHKIAKTDNEGKVVFEELCKGKHWIRVAANNYQVIEEDIYIESCDKVVEVLVKLKPKNSDDCCKNQLKFTIKNDKGELLTNVQIKISKGSDIVATLKTNNGYASSDKKLCKGTYAIRIFIEGYDVMEFVVELNNCDEVLEFSKTLSAKEKCCDAWTKVIVFDNDSKELLNGVKIRIWMDGELVQTLYTEDGWVKFTDLCEGKYGFDIIHESYKSIEWNYEVKCGKEIVFEKGLTKK